MADVELSDDDGSYGLTREGSQGRVYPAGEPGGSEGLSRESSQGSRRSLSSMTDMPVIRDLKQRKVRPGSTSQPSVRCRCLPVLRMHAAIAQCPSWGRREPATSMHLTPPSPPLLLRCTPGRPSLARG